MSVSVTEYQILVFFIYILNDLEVKMQKADIESLLKVALVFVTAISLKPYSFFAKWAHMDRFGALVDGSPCFFQRFMDPCNDSITYSRLH